MKTLTVIIVCAIFISIDVSGQKYGQDTHTGKYKTFYKLTSPKEKLEGLTFSITDTSAIMVESFYYSPSFTNYTHYPYKVIPYQRIMTFKAQKKNRTALSVLVCTILGTGGGILIGVAVAEDSFDSVGVSIGAAAGAVSGIVVGAVIGMTKIVIPINGSKDTFAKEKQRLEKYSVENYKRH